MTTHDPAPPVPEEVADSASLANALESDNFRKFLDHIPFAVAVSELEPAERITYANPEFERLSGMTAADLSEHDWTALPQTMTAKDDGRLLSEVVVSGSDYLGIFAISQDDQDVVADAWSNIIHNDDGKEAFRLVALSDVGSRPTAERSEESERRVLEKDVQLRELQHRVKNNLQMITALIRLEARNLPDKATGERFDKLAGRIEALALLYRAISAEGAGETVDLGVYLSQIASAVIAAHAVEGIHFDLEVDTWQVAIDVALPTGLVVNEVLTNSLKHAFVDSEGGTITVRSLVNDAGCEIVISDDGKGLPDGAQWPLAGKMSSMIVQSLRENARAAISAESAPGKGMRVSIFFAREDALSPPADDE